MLFPAMFTRYVGTVPPGGKALGGDAIPAGQVPAATDNLVTGKAMDRNGGPVRSVQVTYDGPVGAPDLTARMYFYEDGTGAWYEVGAQQTIVAGTTSYWQVVTLMDQPATLANLKVGLGPAQLAQLFVVDAAEGAPEGAYEFTMGPSPVPPPATGGSGGPVTAEDVSYDDGLVDPPLDATDVQSAIDALKGDIGGGGGALKAPFTYTTASPFLIQAVTAGQLITRATLVLTQSFNDPAATIGLGTTADPNLIFAPGDVDADTTSQYDNEGLVVFPSNDYLILTLSPGASTQGAGVLYYWIQ